MPTFYSSFASEAPRLSPWPWRLLLILSMHEVSSTDGDSASGPSLLSWKIEVNRNDSNSAGNKPSVMYVGRASRASNHLNFSALQTWSLATAQGELQGRQESNSEEVWTLDGKRAEVDTMTDRSWALDTKRQLRGGAAHTWQRSFARHGENTGASSLASDQSWAKAEDGQVHSQGRTIRDEAVSDGAQLRHKASVEECMDGNCEHGERTDVPIASADVKPDSLLASPQAPTLPLMMSPEKMKDLDRKVSAIVDYYVKEARKQVKAHGNTLTQQ